MLSTDHDSRTARIFAAVPLLLAAAAGALDGASFTAFHDVVVSAMTGSFVALGRGLGSAPALAPAAWALGGYVLGLVAGTVTAGLAPSGGCRPGAPSVSRSAWSSRSCPRSASRGCSAVPDTPSPSSR